MSLAADVTEGDLSVMQADSDLYHRQAARLPLPAPGHHRCCHGPSAADRVAGIARSRLGGAEGRHQAVAHVFIEAAFVLEYRLRDQGVEFAQELDGFFTRRKSADRS